MSYSTLGGLVTAFLVVVGVYLYASDTPQESVSVPTWVQEFRTPGGQGTGTTSALSIAPGVERWYTNDNPRYSFQLPDGYEAPDIDTGEQGVHGVYVKNSVGSELVVYVHPIASGFRIDEAAIRTYLPEHTIAGLEEITIGTLVRGVKFYSKQQDGSVSVHAWAAYNGFVYMIQAPIMDEPLFAFITERWVFAPPVPSAPQKK